MNILLVSQCHKNALSATRRILDQFAERKGIRTWQTRITREGLSTLRKMLRQSARRNTAVACHWLKKAGDSELLWVVGRQNAFDENGNVPTNSTRRNLLKNRNEHNWQSAEVIALAAGIAGLFHDFGKANILFQNKLAGTSELMAEPYRHEWVSLRLFLAFVNYREDRGWLADLEQSQRVSEPALLERLVKDHPDTPATDAIFTGLDNFARLVAWLVVSHHRLPLASGKNAKTEMADMSDSNQWLEASFCASWNSNNFEKDWAEQNIKDVWRFPYGTPLNSKTWQAKAKQLAQRALNHAAVFERAWLHQRFSAHLARLSLMLADHYYSSLPIEASKLQWCDTSYQAYANTDRSVIASCRPTPTKIAPLKQKLDEHNIGVAHNALLFARNLPLLKTGLPAMGKHKTFSQRAKNAKYRWQDKAYELAYSQALASREVGFFGINMASTGCGKTFANARIMYGLSGAKNCRFNVALGLRTLTLQTGDAYRTMLHLAEDDLAVLIGSQAVKDLHNLREDEKNKAPYDSENISQFGGSESAQDYAEHLYVSYEGEIYDGRLKHWLAASPKLQKMLSAPIMVSTIDHLIPATDSLRGGKQIAPMLRLLTSDLVLDEPDDFGLEDLSALCRLVNWAGVLGSRVLLSSATLPPALVTALFNAYKAGREHFNSVNGGSVQPIGCAWFDEYGAAAMPCTDTQKFKEQHKAFVQKRVANLAKNNQPLRRGQLVPVLNSIGFKGHGLFAGRKSNLQPYITAYAHSVFECIQQLHSKHSVQHASGAKVSLGVVRMANINPMVAVAQALFQIAPPANTRIHYCVYHSQFPLALRSFIEKKLDAALTRYDPNTLWQQPEIAKAIKTDSAKNHIFVVIGTSVVEVGRDHDYDWAICEPSSLRAIIQLAGRVQRHRQKPPASPNLIVFEQNLKALQGNTPAYCKPGFESTTLPLASHNLKDLLADELQVISALARIEQPTLKAEQVKAGHAAESFAVQEHRALHYELSQNKALNASHWFTSENSWHGEHIRQKPFRQSQPQEPFCLYWPEDEPLQWGQWDYTQKVPAWVARENDFNPVDCPMAKGIGFWLNLDAERIYSDLADKLNRTEERASRDYGEIQLAISKNSLWQWHPNLGVFKNYQ